MAASIMAGFTGLLVAGLTTACFFLYQFVIVWALMIATVEVVYVRVKEGEKQSIL